MSTIHFARRVAFIGIVLVVASTTARATVFTDQSAFDALYSGLITNDFEGLVGPGNINSVSNPLAVSGGSVST